MSTLLSTIDEFTVHVTNGHNSKLTFEQSGDLLLENTSRGSAGRALVPDAGDMLTINYGKEFTGGVKVAGQLTLPDVVATPAGATTQFLQIDANGVVTKGDFLQNIPPVPAGLQTDYVRIDPLTGKLYRQD